MSNTKLPTAEEIRAIIAKRHGLGNSLVTGHKAGYFHEAMLEFGKLCAKKALEEGAEKVRHEKGSMSAIDKQSILTAFNYEEEIR